MRVDLSRIGENIKELRATRGWTQQDLATAARLSPRTIARYEKGDRSFGSRYYYSLRAIARAFNVDFSDLTRQATSPPNGEETGASHGSTNDVPPTCLAPSDIRVLREARVFQFSWDVDYGGYTWLQAYGVPRDIGLPDVGYTIWTRSLPVGWSETKYRGEAWARIARGSDREAMLHWQRVVESCRANDILYLVWGCDQKIKPEQVQEGLCVDTLDVSILRDDAELANCRLITRIAAPDSPDRLFRLKSLGYVVRL